MLNNDSSSQQNEVFKLACPTWYENDFLKFLLEDIPESFEYAHLILQILEVLEKRKQTLRNDNFGRLQNKSWLVDQKGNPRSLQQVIYLPALESETTQIFSQVDSWDYVTPTMLQEDLDISYFQERQEQEKLLLSGEYAIDKLGEAIGKLPEYFLGDLEISTDFLATIADIFQDCDYIPAFSVQDKNLKSWEGKGLIGVSRKPKKPS